MSGSFVRKIVTAQTGIYRFEAELIDKVTVTDDLVYGTFEAYTYEYVDKEQERLRREGRKLYMSDDRWTDVIRIDAGPTAFTFSVRTDTITYRRNA